MQIKYFDDNSCPNNKLVKLRALDALQGVRSLPFDLEIYTRKTTTKNTRRSSNTRRDVKNKSRIASANLADTFAHDLIDELLSSRHKVTTSRFVMLHNCHEVCNSTMPLIDGFSIRAPCCMAYLYQFPSRSQLVLNTKSSRDKSEELKEAERPLSKMSTSTPKNKSSARSDSRGSEQRNMRDSPYMASSSSSSQTAEHHETPLGQKYSAKGGYSSTEARVDSRSTNEISSTRSSSSANEPHSDGTRISRPRRRRSIFGSNQTEASFDFSGFLNLDSNDSDSVFRGHRSYDESLFIQTDLKKDRKDFFESASSQEKSITFEKDRANSGSVESVIRHPSYFSDSENSLKNESPTKDVTVSNSESLTSVFAGEVTDIIEGELGSEERPKSSVETQTEASYIRTRSTEPEVIACADCCSKCSMKSATNTTVISMKT